MTPLQPQRIPLNSSEMCSQIPPVHVFFFVFALFTCILYIIINVCDCIFLYSMFICISTPICRRICQKKGQILFLITMPQLNNNPIFLGKLSFNTSSQEAVLAIDSTMMEAFQFQEILGSLVSQGLPTHMMACSDTISGLLLLFLYTFCLFTPIFVGWKPSQFCSGGFCSDQNPTQLA